MTHLNEVGYFLFEGVIFSKCHAVLFFFKGEKWGECVRTKFLNFAGFSFIFPYNFFFTAFSLRFHTNSKSFLFILLSFKAEEDEDRR